MERDGKISVLLLTAKTELRVLTVPGGCVIMQLIKTFRFLEAAMATIRDVAKYANVSISTVSLVLNNSQAVKHETKYKVYEAIKALNYIPNQSARSLVTKHSRVIGVIKGMEHVQNTIYSFEGLVDTYLSEMLHSIETQIEQNQYSMMIDWCFNPEEEALYVPVMDPSKVDGLLYVGGFLSDGVAQRILQTGIPAVLIGSRHEAFDYVDTMPEKGILQAVRYLVECGHREIAFINGPEASHSSGRKLAGFMDAAGEFGLQVVPEWILKGDYTGRAGYENARKLWACAQHPTAIVTAADCVAVGALRFFYEHGVMCPGDISIIGFEDSILSEYSVPPLTSVCVRKDILGTEGTKVLINRIANSKAKHVRLTIEPELICRDSVAKLQNAP